MIPMPVSLMLISISWAPFISFDSTCTWPPSGVNFTALLRRLNSICLSFLLSASITIVVIVFDLKIQLYPMPQCLLPLHDQGCVKQLS